jgi:cytidylate kinase
MGYRAIALSQVYGSGAESIGRSVARQLGFGYLNEAIVAQVASDYDVDPAIVSEAEQRKSFFSRLAEMAGRGAPEVLPDTSLFDETDTLLWLIRDAVRDAADRGNVVLVAHAACYACSGRSDVLRVWATAPPSVRASRMASALELSDKEAAKSVREQDAARASYLKRAYGVAEESNTDYDIVINTERLTTDAAAGLIVGLVRARALAREAAGQTAGGREARCPGCRLSPLSTSGTSSPSTLAA